jgi:hypothetical protein
MPLAAQQVPEHASGGPLPSTERAGTISDMQAFLARIHPHSAAHALRLLRNAYPDASLTQRVAACSLLDR